MKKVIRIITRLNIGGPAIHTLILSGSLNKDEYKDILICGKPAKSEGDMSYLAERYNVKPLIIPELGREISFFNDVKSLISIYRIIKREKPDIVHTHTAKAGALGRLAAFAAGVPVRVHTFHGHIFDGYFSPTIAKIFLLIERFLARFTDRIVTVSETVKYDIVDQLKVAKNKKSAVIPLGLDLDGFLQCEKLRGNFRKKLNLGDDVLLVGIVGRLVPIKNHKMFLEAAGSILKRKPAMNVKFLVIGDGEYGTFLRSCAKDAGIEEHVIFTGWIRDLAEAYADLDVVALTSLNEGTPVSLIEAMASSRAVVSADAGGVKDLVRPNENGLLSKINDVEGFSDNLFSLLLDKDARVRMGTCGRESVKAKYGKERLVRDIENLYEECINEKISSKSKEA